MRSLGIDVAQYPAVIALSSLDGTTGFKLTAEDAGGGLGFAVASLGDINGDGVDDMIVGAKDAGAVNTYSGAAYVVFGKAGGFAASIAVSSLNGGNGFTILNGGTKAGASYVVFGKTTGFNLRLDVTTLNGTNGFRIDGEVANDFSGYSVSSAGNFNGDGFDDLLIGATGADVGAPIPATPMSCSGMRVASSRRSRS